VNRDLWGRFGVRFLASAHKRIADARGLLGGGDAKAAMRVAAEFHGLAGEAGMIGIEEIAELARSGERAARAWASHPASVGSTESQACATMLDAIDARVRALEVPEN